MSGCICHTHFISGCPHCHQRAGLPQPTKEEMDASIRAAQSAREVTTALRPMNEAPQDATSFLAWATDRYGNRRWLVVHWADGGGEEQPRFRGWFHWTGHGHTEIEPKYLLGWTTLPEAPR